MKQEQLDDYVDEALPDEDRLQNLRALSSGLYAGLHYYLNRLSRYQDLLELELEDRPGGKMYLEEAAASLAKANSLLEAFGPATIYRDDEFESFDLALVASGMAARVGRVGNLELELDISALEHEEAFIRGQLFLFQQVLFDLPRLLQGVEGDALKLSIAPLRLEDAFFRNRRSALKAGEYFALTLRTPDQEWDMNDLVTLNERLAHGDLTSIVDRLIFVYGVIVAHGGDLFTRKSDQNAIEFLTLLLPAQRNRVSMYTESGVDDSELKGSETILLVDDEAIIWDVVIDMLQGMGYTVVLAADGRDCVEIYQENPGEIDLVLLDMVMPEMNGKEAFFALKEIDPDVKVLLQSGYIQEEDARDVLDAGAKGFLRKPYRMRQLASHIRDIVAS